MTQEDQTQARAALHAGVLNVILVGAANFDNGRTHLCVADMILADMIVKLLDDHFRYQGEVKADYIPQTQAQVPQGDLALKVQEALEQPDFSDLSPNDLI